MTRLVLIKSPLFHFRGSELSERRESTFEYKVRPLEYHARESLHSPRKSATRGNSAKISTSLPESLFTPGKYREMSGIEKNGRLLGRRAVGNFSGTQKF